VGLAKGSVRSANERTNETKERVMHAQATKKMFKVLIPVEKKGGGTYWMRVGTGFPGKDGGTSLNLYVDAFPANAKMLHVREMDEEDLQRISDRRVDRRPINEPVTAEAAGQDLPF
jgi:hypothetical protein